MFHFYLKNFKFFLIFSITKYDIFFALIYLLLHSCFLKPYNTQPFFIKTRKFYLLIIYLSTVKLHCTIFNKHMHYAYQIFSN